MNNESSNKRIAKNTLFLYFRMFIVLMISLYTTRVIFSTLGIVDYGIYNVVSGFVTLFFFFSTSMANAVQRYYNVISVSKGESGETSVFNTSFIIQFLLGIAVLIILETFGGWYIESAMVIPSDRLCATLWVFHASMFSLFLVIMQIPFSAAIIAHEHMDYYAFVNIAEVVARLIIVLILPYLSYDKLICYGWLTLAVTLLSLLLYAIYSYRQFKWLRLHLQFDRDLLSSMMKFIGWNFFGTFAFSLQGQGVNLILNAFFGPIVNAARGIATMIMNAVQGFQTNIVLAFRPQLMQAYSMHDFKRTTAMFFTLSKLVYFLLAIIALPLILELEEVLNLWLGTEYPRETMTFTVLILVNMVIGSLNSPVTQIIHASGQMKAYQLTFSGILFTLLPLSWLVLKAGTPAESVFIVNIIITIICQGACLYVMSRIYPCSLGDYLNKVILPLALWTICIPVVPLLLRETMNQGLIRLCVTGIASLISSTIMGYYIVLSSAEKDTAITFVKPLINRFRT